MHLQKPEIRKNVCKNIKSKITSRYIKQKNNTKRLQIVLEVEYVQYIYNNSKTFLVHTISYAAPYYLLHHYHP